MQPESPGVDAPLSEIFDSVEDAVSVIDRDLRLIYVNDAFCALVGWPRPVLLGAEPPMPWWTADEAERAAVLMRRLLDGGEIDGPSEERVYKHRSGREIPVGIRSSLLRDEHGAVTALVAFTSRLGEDAADAPVDAMRDERERYARAEEARRIAAQTTAGVIEEMGAPVGVIRDQVASLIGELAGTPQEEGLRAIAGAVERLDLIARDLLAVAEASTAEVTVDLSPLDLVPLTLAALADMGRDADRRGVRLRGDLAPSAVIRGDAPRLLQALESLMGTALRRAPLETEVRVGIRCGGGWAVLEVDDRGPGLDDAAREALFAAVPGAGGIGPSIARSVARAHGGELDALDLPSGGLLLRLTLPLAEDGPGR